MSRAHLAIIQLAMLVFAADANAQKRCTKGIPCGNTCIAANKTCHVGQGTATKAEALPVRALPRDTTVASRDSTLPWIAAKAGTTFYANSDKCRGRSLIRELGAANVVYFKSAADAKKFGLIASDLPGCT